VTSGIVLVLFFFVVLLAGNGGEMRAETDGGMPNGEWRLIAASAIGNGCPTEEGVIKILLCALQYQRNRPDAPESQRKSVICGPHRDAMLLLLPLMPATSTLGETICGFSTNLKIQIFSRISE